MNKHWKLLVCPKTVRERNETKIEWTRPFDNNYTKLPCGGVVCGGNQNLVGLQIVVTV